MRESLARVVCNPVNLEEDEWRERPVDIIHAMAKAQVRTAGKRYNLTAIGRALYPAMTLPRGDQSLDGAICAAAEALAAALMVPGFRLNLLSPTARLVALHAIREHRDPVCRVCKGRIDTTTGMASIPDVDKLKNWKEGDGPVPMKPCPACGGSGVHKYGDDERTNAVGDDAGRMDRAFSTAHSLISAAMIELDRVSTELRRDR